MSKDAINQYDATAANNTDVGGISIDEGMLPSNVNNALREIMSHLKDVDAGTSSLTSPVISGDLTVDTDTLFVDASADAVGIGTSSPTSNTILHVKAADAQIELEGTNGSNSAFIDFDGTNLQLSTNRNMIDGAFSNTGKANAAIFLAGPSGGSDIKFATASANNTVASERMRIDSSGNVVVGGTTAQLTSSGRGNITINGSSDSILNLGTGGGQGAYFYHDGTNTNVWNTKNGYLRFATNDSERMRIDSSGNVGIGVSSPTGKLHVGGTIVLSASGTDANRASVFYNTSTGQLILVTSDARLKKDFDYDIAGIETVKKLKPLRYSWKDSDKRQLGFLAQESIEADEHLAWNDTENDHWGLDGWDGYAAVLTKAIQEQQVIIEDLKTRIEELENSNG